MDYNNLLLDYNNLLLDYNNLLLDYNNPIIIIYYYYNPRININPSCPVSSSCSSVTFMKMVTCIDLSYATSKRKSVENSSYI